MAKVENFVPFEPLGIETSVLKHVGLSGGCGCQVSKEQTGCGCTPVSQKSEFSKVGPVPQVIVVEEDEIKSAKDIIDGMFDLIKSNTFPKCKDVVLDALDLSVPKAELKDKAELQDAVITKVADKIFAKMQGRIALIKSKERMLGCHKSGETVEYFVAPADPTSEKFRDLDAESRDGVIEDLVGVIEVTPGVN